MNIAIPLVLILGGATLDAGTLDGGSLGISVDAEASSNFPRNAASLGSFTLTGDLVNTTIDYDYTRVPDGRDETDLSLPPDMSGWGDIDVTNSAQMDTISCPAEAVKDSGTTDDDDAGILCCMVSGAAGARRCHLPQGEYWVNTTLRFTVGNRQLYGDGIDSTVIRGATNVDFWVQVGSDSKGSESSWTGGTAKSWTAGFTKGTRVLTLANVTSLVPGDFIEMRCTPFTSCTTRSDATDNGGGNHQEVKKLTCVGTSGSDDCSGLGATDVKIDMGIVDDFGTSGTTTTVVEITAARQIGIDGITFRDEFISGSGSPQVAYPGPGGVGQENDGHGGNQGIFYGSGVVEAFITNNEFLRGSQQTVYFIKTAMSLFSGNYVEQLMDISSGQCFALMNSHEDVVVNNIFKCAVAVEFNQQPSGVHNMIAYNYFPNPPVKSDPCTSPTDIDCDCVYMTVPGTGSCRPAICSNSVSGCDCTNYSGNSIGRAVLFHGPDHRANIFEGNDITCRVQWDNAFGRSGRYNTFYRNRLRMIDAINANPSGTNMKPDPSMVGRIGNESGERFSFGNFLGNFAASAKSNSETTFDASGHTETALLAERNVWYDVCHVSKSGGDRDPACTTRASDVTDPTGVWANNTLASSAPASWTDTETWPTSLIYDAKPSWWCNEACPWAAVGGIGAFGDVEPTGLAGVGVGSKYANGLVSLCKTPAQIRYEGGTCTLP